MIEKLQMETLQEAVDSFLHLHPDLCFCTDGYCSVCKLRNLRKMENDDSKNANG